MPWQEGGATTQIGAKHGVSEDSECEFKGLRFLTQTRPFGLENSCSSTIQVPTTSHFIPSNQLVSAQVITHRSIVGRSLKFGKGNATNTPFGTMAVTPGGAWHGARASP